MNKSLEISLLQNNIAGLNKYPILLRNLPTYLFFDGNKFPLPAKMPPGWALFLSLKPLRTAEIYPAQSLELPFGHIYPIFCAGLAIGYLIEFPSQIVNIQNRLISAVRRRSVRIELFSDVGVLFKDRFITVFSSNDEAILIVRNKVEIFQMRRNQEEKNTG